MFKCPKSDYMTWSQLCENVHFFSKTFIPKMMHLCQSGAAGSHLSWQSPCAERRLRKKCLRLLNQPFTCIQGILESAPVVTHVVSIFNLSLFMRQMCAGVLNVLTCLGNIQKRDPNICVAQITYHNMSFVRANVVIWKIKKLKEFWQKREP